MDFSSIAQRYLQLADAVQASPLANKRECLDALYTSFFLLNEGQQAGETSVQHPSRAGEVFSQFLRLLETFHLRERSVGFYAGKLALSPKYFSKLVRQASSHGASDWIDSFVIRAARHLLRDTDLSIKEIVFRLNFPDQPSFTKYFKTHAGVTPAQFRKL
jgi:AraC-like DNA-binding protein